jgi:phosphomannomutase
VKCSSLRSKFPEYIIAKKKIETGQETDFKAVMNDIRNEFRGNDIDERDGMRIDLSYGWVQVRKSNTEPIIRVYAEGKTRKEAEELAEKVIKIVKKH